MVDLIQAATEAWAQAATLKVQNEALLIRLYRSEEENVNLRNLLGMLD